MFFFCKSVTNCSVHSFINLGCRISDLCDFDGFSFEMAFMTAFSEMSTVVIISLKSLSWCLVSFVVPQIQKHLMKLIQQFCRFGYCR